MSTSRVHVATGAFVQTYASGVFKSGGPPQAGNGAGKSHRWTKWRDCTVETSNANNRSKIFWTEVCISFLSLEKKIGPTGTWTRIAGFRVQSDNHYTIGPNTIGITPGGTRTHNLTLRRGAPYPLGHRGIGLKCSRRGSNPRPSAHKTNALPLSYGSCCDQKPALHINT